MEIEKLLEELILVPGVSGYEDPIRANKTRFPLKSVAGRAPGRAIGRSAGADRFAEAKMTKNGVWQEAHGFEI